MPSSSCLAFSLVEKGQKFYFWDLDAAGPKKEIFKKTGKREASSLCGTKTVNNIGNNLIVFIRVG